MGRIFSSLLVNTNPARVVAAFGPAIGKCCYEAGPEVAQAYTAQFAQAREWFDGPFAERAAGEKRNPLKWRQGTWRAETRGSLATCAGATLKY